MQRRFIIRNAALAAVGFGAGVGVLGFSAADSSTPRPGLEAYRPEAVRAVSDDTSKLSNTQLTVAMEVRNVCWVLTRYTRDKGTDFDLLARRLQDAMDRTHDAPDGKGDGEGAIDDYVRYALVQVDASRKEGSTTPIQAFVKSECDPKQDLSQPILTSDGG